MAEMNNCNNPYAAYDCDGSSRGPLFSSGAFKQAWRRVALIMRGGLVSLINAKLAALDLPKLKTRLAYLPTPKVAMVWVPMVGGSPDIPALEPSAYFPGRQWVDWVGTDFYSRYPNWAGLDSFYADYAHVAPFTFGEYAIWDGDNPSLGAHAVQLGLEPPTHANAGLQRRLPRLLADALPGQCCRASQRPGRTEVPGVRT